VLADGIRRTRGRWFDTLVVGGGTAGCVLAARLSEDDDRSVCLIEAGPDYGPYEGGRWPADMLDARRLAFSHSWETDREDRSQLRARIIGGCSAHNACVALRGAPSDYDEWGHGWSHAELEPFLDRSERELRVRPTERDELSPWHAAFAEDAGDDPILHPVNAVGTVRWNAAFAYLDPARPRANLTVIADTLVDAVVHDGGRATGVRSSAGEIGAGEVVLTASAYGSPAILLRSGIGPETGLPVGENLLDHVGVGIGWDGTPELQRAVREFAKQRPTFMAQVSVRASSSACPAGVWDLFLFPAIDETNGRYDVSAAVFAMKPRSRGRVRLNDLDPRTPLAIEHGFLADERDAGVLVEGFERLRELGTAPAVRPYAGAESRPGPAVGAHEHVAATARGFFHPVGTCGIGSVVDGDGRVLGFENLVVADASIMPTIPRANTNVSVAAVAERIADRLRAG